MTPSEIKSLKKGDRVENRLGHIFTILKKVDKLPKHYKHMGDTKYYGQCGPPYFHARTYEHGKPHKALLVTEELKSPNWGLFDSSSLKILTLDTAKTLPFTPK